MILKIDETAPLKSVFEGTLIYYKLLNECAFDAYSIESRSSQTKKYFFTVFSRGDRGAGDREKRGREVYGRREKRGREAGFPRWREAGEKGKNYATLRNISQAKKCKGPGAKKYRAGTGLKGTGSGKFKPPCPPLFISVIRRLK